MKCHKKVRKLPKKYYLNGPITHELKRKICIKRLYRWPSLFATLYLRLRLFMVKTKWTKTLNSWTPEIFTVLCSSISSSNTWATWGWFQLLHRQIPKAQKIQSSYQSFLGFWDLCTQKLLICRTLMKLTPVFKHILLKPRILAVH